MTAESDLRSLVLEMLRVSGAMRSRLLHASDLQSSVTIFEVFIRIFLDALEQLIRRGLRAGYVPYEDNEKFFKGKLDFSEQIKRNLAHAERFYVHYDAFTFDRAENKLIKSTLELLRGISKDRRNVADLNKFLLMFSEIAPSENYEADLARCADDRSAIEYEDILVLCRMFLRRRGSSIYAGRDRAFALLFPMEQLFETYVAHEMESALVSGWRLKAQSTQLSLFSDAFTLRPDILLEKNGECILADTKWKLLNAREQNNGISQADMYQMYAYHTRFSAERVVLLYPYSEAADGAAGKEYVSEVYGQKVTVCIALFDLMQRLRGEPFAQCIHAGGKTFLPLR